VLAPRHEVACPVIVDLGQRKQQEAVMTRYYFAIHHSTIVAFTDEEGEEFETQEKAIAHALIVANELSRNNLAPVTVVVLGNDRTVLGHVSANKFEPTTFPDLQNHALSR